MGRAPVFLAALLSFIAQTSFAQETYNLLTRPDLVFLQQQSAGLDLSGALPLYDQNLENGTTITVSAQEQVELVFSFSNAVVTPTALRLQTKSLENNQASIEVLVSEQGADTGYLSLRTEPLKRTNGWQKFKFEPAAARWLMVKVTAFGDKARFDLAELEIEGYDGSPVSLYAFDEAPANALEVLKGLEQSDISFDIHPDEQSLFEDAADGKLDTWSFAEASLLSSGVYKKELRQQYLQQINTLTEEARSVTNTETDKFTQGRLLLDWLHKGVMKNGYVETQTDMSSVLQAQHFNCVSSSTLYNIIARRLGLDARGIEVPDHAFTILYDDTDHVDVETTTPQGFDPARDRAALNAFSRTTGYTYISDKHRAKRREINEAGLVALTYYNHGVNATEAGDYPLALLNYFRALSLDPRNKSAVKNTLVVLSRWSHQTIEQNKSRRAVDILDVALSFAPADRQTRHNMRYALQESMLAANTQAEVAELSAIATAMYERTQDETFLRLQTRVLQNKAYSLAENGDFEGALQLTETHQLNIDDSARRTIERFRASIFLNWSNSALNAGDYALATNVLERALKEPRADYRVKNNIAYTAQEWGAAVAAAEGPEASQALLLDLSNRFPDIKSLNKVAAHNYAKEATTAFESNDFETAIAIYQAAQKAGVGGSTMARNERVAWNNWGLSVMDKGNFQGALAIFERAHEAHPTDAKYKNNIAYIVQEWGRVISEQEGVEAAEKTVALQHDRFEDISQLNRLQGTFVNQAVNNAKTASDFNSLESTVKEVGKFYARQSQYKNLVAYFYQEWAKTAHPNFEDDSAIAILQSGLDKHPENRDVKKMFIYAVNNFGDQIASRGDTHRALSIFQSATRTLSNERSFKNKIAIMREQVN